MGKEIVLFYNRSPKLINIERTMEIEKSPFGKNHSNNCYKQESSTDTKISGENYMRNGIDIVIKHLLTGCLLI